MMLQRWKGYRQKSLRRAVCRELQLNIWKGELRFKYFFFVLKRIYFDSVSYSFKSNAIVDLVCNISLFSRKNVSSPNCSEVKSKLQGDLIDYSLTLFNQRPYVINKKAYVSLSG
jgi:hypothetical protein